MALSGVWRCLSAWGAPGDGERIEGLVRALLDAQGVVRAEGATWISAKSDDHLTKEWTLRGGETKVLRAEEELLVSLGNAGVVKLNYNGMELGFIGRKGEVKKSLVFAAFDETGTVGGE